MQQLQGGRAGESVCAIAVSNADQSALGVWEDSECNPYQIANPGKYSRCLHQPRPEMRPWTAGTTSVHHTSWTSFRLQYVSEKGTYIQEGLAAKRRQTASTACSFKTPVFMQQITRPNSPHKREMCSSMCVTEQSTASEFSPWNRVQSGFPENADIWSFQYCEKLCYVVGREFQHGCPSPTVRPWRWKHYRKYSSIDRSLIFQQIWIFRTSKLTLTSVYQNRASYSTIFTLTLLINSVQLIRHR